MNPLLAALISALMITIITECIVLTLLIRKDFGLLLLYTTLINGFTNPLLNFFFIICEYSILPLEMGVVIIEAVLICLLVRIGIRYSLCYSVCANITSYLIGKMVIFATVT